MKRRGLPLFVLFSLSVTMAASPAPADTARPIARKATLVRVQASDADAARARSHVIQVPGLVRAMTEDQIDGPALVAVGPLKKTPVTPKLDVAKFGETVHAAFKDKVRGYALGLRKNGQPVLTLQWDHSRTAAPALDWTLDTRMHVASVSKLITAIVMTKMLDERGLSFDTKIGNYLPAYWNEGKNANDITFRALMTHQAAFTIHDGDYLSFKRQIEMGVSTNPADGIGYTNGVFSLLRVLGSTMTGAVDKSYWYTFPMFGPSQEESFNDALWDLKTTHAFLSYAQAKVFTPSGVSGVSPAPTPAGAHAFSGKTDVKGWDSGDVSTQLGGAGFRLSVNEVLDVMGTFRRKGTIVSPAKAKESIEARLGIDRVIDTPAGKIYEKNGRWQNGSGPNDDCEQSVAVYLQENMEVVVFVNSWLPMQASLRNAIRDAYIASLQ